MKNNNSILILGGGIAGLSSSLELNRYGFNVTVLESSAYDTYCPGEHLIPEALPLLEKLNIPDSVWSNDSLKCFNIQSSWGHDGVISKESVFNAHGEGVLLSRPKFDKKLSDFTASTGVNIKVNSRVNSLRKCKQGWIAEYTSNKDSKSIQADFVIDASGRNSKFTSSFGIKKNKYDNLTGTTIFCTPNCDKEIQNGRILIESTKNGWWYSAVLKDNLLVATYMTDADILCGFGAVEDALQYFISSSNHTKALLNKFNQVSEIYTVSAKSQIMSQLSGNNWIMVGDSAWSIDPLSSQGIYKAMLMGVAAAKAINGLFSGDNCALNTYDRKFKEIFYAYIGLRTKYYQMETRWHEDTFWSRRQIPYWPEIPITIDPTMKINFPSNFHHDKHCILNMISPAIDVGLLIYCLKSSTSVMEATSSYINESKYFVEHKEVIIAIQEIHKHYAN